VENGKLLEETKGDYGAEGFVYQKLCKLPEYDGNHPVIGSWVIGGEPAGIGIREGSSLVTNNTSRFLPHYFE
jgi:glutathionylspermidine synthase